ncbi:hypothetical protein CK203_017838 [Vitis vinifera]|uniref:Uncharacterized protein n=1 Tax=Vitis vinifera TaxID=29760 RepID=A0A438JGY3_VITVI|nr:hypothetical protein CK203_017838 [Vitis vinifera]
MGYANVMRISHNTLWNAKFSHNLEQLDSEGHIFLISAPIVHGLKRWILTSRALKWSIDTFDLGSASWIRVRGRLIRVLDQSDQTDMDSQIDVTPPPAMVAVPTSEDTHARMDRLE